VVRIARPTGLNIDLMRCFISCRTHELFDDSSSEGIASSPLPWNKAEGWGECEAADTIAISLFGVP